MISHLNHMQNKKPETNLQIINTKEYILKVLDKTNCGYWAIIETESMHLDHVENPAHEFCGPKRHPLEFGLNVIMDQMLMPSIVNKRGIFSIFYLPRLMFRYQSQADPFLLHGLYISVCNISHYIF
jgi:hypothetical protein